MGLLDHLTGLAGLTDDVREEIALAFAFSERGDFGTAVSRLSALAEAHPRAVPVQLALGELRARQADDEGAVAAFGRAVDLSVDAVDGWLGLGEALVRLGRPDPARDAFRRVLSQSDDPPRRARAHAGRGRLALAAGRLAKAVRELRRAAELAPEEITVAADLGRALVAARDPEGSQWLMRAARAALDGDAADLTLVTEAAASLPTGKAAEELLRAAASSPRLDDGARAVAQAALARRLAEGSRLDEARTLAAAALAAAPSSAPVLAAWRDVARAGGDYREALRAARRAVEVGAVPDSELFVRLALGARDLAHIDDERVRRFVDGEASDDDLVVLGSLAPTDEARVFVAQAASLGPAPTGNLYALLAYARDLAARAPELQRLLPVAARSVEAFDRPLLVAVMGEFNAGKSSFVNAFCGQEVAPVGVTPTTATINVLRYGPPGGRVLYHDGQVRELGALEVAPFLRDLGEEAADVRTVEIFFPLDVLRRVEIVDTPGLNSLRTEHEKVARAFLTEADAIVWLFAVGQAAKATERDALGLAHAAGKRVLGVLNKADQASTEELAGVVRHVQQGLGDRIEALLPLSARLALQGRPEASGLPAVLQALEERFFGHARTLKRRTALAALTRFGGEARALLPDEDPDPAPARLRALDAAEQTLRGALAAERVGLRGRLEHAFRHAAGEVLEFVGPRRWPFGEARAAAADEEFLFDFLEDALGQATDVTRAALEEAAAAGPPVPIVAAVERFRAYGRGVLAGGLVERTLREELSTAGPGRERASVERALMRHLPDVDGELLTPLAAEVTSVYARARVACDEESRRLAMRRMLRAERLDRPLAALEVAVAAIEKN